MTDVQSSAPRGRSCGTCALCCKLVGIAELNKPMGQWCPHCLKRGGCGIYPSRPEECRTFNCGWLTNAEIGEEWLPTRSKMVLHHVTDAGVNKLVVHVDPGSPLAWKNEPYYSQLKRWARNFEAQNGLVNLYIGKRVIVLLPQKEVDLGTFNIGDTFRYEKWRVGSGWEYDFNKVSQGA
jgi:hypothetical protein